MSSSIERQYMSPNCVLSLQGFSEESDNQEAISVMSVLTLAKCQIIGNSTTLQGGLTFLEHLLHAVSSYTHDLLSGLNHPVESKDKNDYIYLTNLEDKKRHLLIWQKEKGQTDDQLELELTTVQLFDLLDALDQLYQDPLTLPQLKDEIKPLSRRHRQAEVSFVEQSTPATLGFVGFTLAAIALFFIPNPNNIKDPNQEPQPARETNQQVIPVEIPSKPNENE
ncbi:DUF4335 domain-containing protein [Cyanobacterium aponinum]|uniref:DUF4335 domain-containing protein n=1 Tax=Cyanobacterium aponinum TaxID=379064 RepID=UPI000C12D20E|nr:DUF4335 domain-containing protein [Cyanobacterium aponinum]PHV63322.1 hypothetical protein CSQ80_06180 [Cyanobacterium aponinum IPPAS B-1201]